MTARKRTAAFFSQWPEHWACLLPVNLSTSPHSLVLSVLQCARLPECECGVAVSRRRKQHYSTNDRLSRLLLVDQSTRDRLVQAPHPLRLIDKRPSRNSQKYTHTHTRLTALCPGLPRWADTRKVKPIWILLKQETVSGSGISWAICKSAPRSRQITMTAPHHSVFYRPDALPAGQPTASKHWRNKLMSTSRKMISNYYYHFMAIRQY